MLGNGTAFMTDDIRRIHERNGVRAVKSAPHHSSTNSQAERYDAVLKKTVIQDPTECRLSRFLSREHAAARTSSFDSVRSISFSFHILYESSCLKKGSRLR